MKKLIGLLVISLTLFVGCGGGSDTGNNKSASAEKESSGLTEFEQKNGIGPVTEEIKLSSISKELAKKGENIFEMKCSSCHKMDERYVGPAQRDLLDRRSPEYIMNMILNPAEMVKKHPEAKKMLQKFMTPMPNQNLSREEARAIVEYFRYMNKHENQMEIQ
ncbi:MAG: cytochrome c [Fodinibius sp.]|nr:cytochrome c [Fodinibius sp.]